MPSSKQKLRKPRSGKVPETGAGTRAKHAFETQWFRIAVVLILTLLLQPFLTERLYFTGDEPHYLLAAMSFVRDGDFDLANNYREQQAREFGGWFLANELVPQRAKRDDGVLDAEHGTGFPLAIAPAYKLGGVSGVRKFLIVLAALTCLLTGAITDSLTGNRWAGSIAALLLAVSPTWQMQASRVYPDVVACFLASIAMLIIARRTLSPDRPVTFAGGLTTGVCLGLLPILYLKYVVLAVPLAFTALLVPNIARSKGFYTGGGIALGCGVASTISFGTHGAFGGSFVGADSFSIAGAFGRYWKQWLDSHHGLFVYQPYTLLSLWASVHYLKPLYARSARERVLTGLAVVVLAYTGMHAFWIYDPGYSNPGRYLMAIVPVICILVATWATQADAFRAVRLVTIGVSGLTALAFSLEGMRRDVQPDFAFRAWNNLFTAYWPSWHTAKAPFKRTEVGSAAYLVPAFIVLTKLVKEKIWRHF
jgi:hypothetical protein